MTARAPGLGDLYRAHAVRVAAWVRKLGGGEAEVDDLVHEVFLVAERRLGEFRGEAPVTTWLYRITERVVFAHRRRRLGPNIEAVPEPVSPATGPDAALEAAELRGAVQDTLQSLPLAHRQVLELGLMRELTAREVADTLELTEGAVWVRAHRAKKLFRARFSKRHPGLVPLVAAVLALLLLSAGATAIAHWVRSQASDRRAPAPRQTRSVHSVRAAPVITPSPEDPMPSKLAPIALATTLIATPLAARAAPPAPEAEKVVHAKITRLDFSELKLTGHVERPEGSFVHSRRNSRFACMVKVRGDFVPELLSSVDQL